MVMGPIPGAEPHSGSVRCPAVGRERAAERRADARRALGFADARRAPGFAGRSQMALRYPPCASVNRPHAGLQLEAGSIRQRIARSIDPRAG
jgi:hypothetical protein